MLLLLFFFFTEVTRYIISIRVEYVFFIHTYYSITCYVQNEICSYIYFDCFTIVMFQIIFFFSSFLCFVVNPLFPNRNSKSTKKKKKQKKRQGSFLNELLKIFSESNENGIEANPSVIYVYMVRVTLSSLKRQERSMKNEQK